MTRVGVLRAAVAGKLWQIAILTAAGTLGAAADAQAARYYWSDRDFGYSRWEVISPRQRQRPHHHPARKIEAPEKKVAAKPQGPLIIAISIEKQKLRIYDANGLFAETPISTGMRGHPTPMGVFSIIQKHKWHHSNIYSGAPMPYMQRITWSGVAMHAGVLPGYPASHGCIRMPMAFAIKMWGWTRMGARVIVTPGEITPASFSHPLLATEKVVPQPSAAADPPADPNDAAKSDRAATADPVANAAVTVATSEVSLELRSTVGHDDDVIQVMDDSSASASLRDQTHTADASHNPAATEGAGTMTDATTSAENATPRAKAEVKSGAENAEAATPATDPAAAKPGETASSADKPVESKPSDATTGQANKSATDTSDNNGKKADGAAVAAQPGGDAAPTDAPATANAAAEPDAGDKAAEKKVDAKADDVNADDVKAADVKPADAKPADVKPADGKIEADTGADATEQAKDQARFPDSENPAKPDPAAALPILKPHGRVAVFVSRKDSKLYVRQNFEPLFAVPVTIAPSDRPLGTHVFTAQVDKDDANILHWSVVSLPVRTRHAERHERKSHHRKVEVVEVKETPLPDSPAEALDRLSIPAGVMPRIAAALSSGGSIIVSDQGIRTGETGEGTDFILPLR
jgi:L,D-transpeptidase catalytic domain